MNKKGNKTTTGPIDWNLMLGLMERLKRDNRYQDFLLIHLGCYFGLRIGDLLKLRWGQLTQVSFEIIETKTKKRREITINPAVRIEIDRILAVANPSPEDFVLCNRWGTPYSLSYANRRIKKIFADYGVKTKNGSSHSLRKTFGRRVWDLDGQSERALIYLSKIFNHSSSQVTREYIGIEEEDIRDIYVRL